jgi:hypothetical protein
MAESEQNLSERLSESLSDKFVGPLSIAMKIFMEAKDGLDPRTALADRQQLKELMIPSTEPAELTPWDGGEGAISVYELAAVMSDNAPGTLFAGTGGKKDAKTMNTTQISAAAGKVRGGGGGGGASTTVAARSSGTSTNFTTVIDIFVAIMQKLGVWMYNLFPHLPVDLPAFTVSMSWLRVPALGWELAVTLPDLEMRGWLYWLVLLIGILVPFAIGYVLATDDGNLNEDSPSLRFFLPKASTTSNSGKVSKVNDNSNSSDKVVVNSQAPLGEDEYKTAASRGSLAVIFVCAVLAATLISLGLQSGADGQLAGLGVLFLLAGVLNLLWVRFKLYILEGTLAKQNRKLLSSYRLMRVFVCSNVLMLLLRTIYIMTISALCQTVMDSIGNSNRTAELVIALVCIGPACFAFPLFVYWHGLAFQEQYVDPLEDDVKSDADKYRGWLERLHLREAYAPMKDSVLALMILPFEKSKWYFAVVQLMERALATMCATLLVDNTLAQLCVVIAIEATQTIHEGYVRPFVNDQEDRYNILWRCLALAILVVALLLEVVGEDFAATGDVLLVLLSLTVILFFLYAIDIPRILAIMKRGAATKRFREEKLHLNVSLALKPDNAEDGVAGGAGSETVELPETLGNLGLDPISDVVNVTKTIQNACDKLPNGVSPADVAAEAFSFAQQYRVLSCADGNEELFDLILRNHLMWKVEPLVSLTDCQIGTSIPKCIGAYGRVSRLLLGGMNLSDDCSLTPLRTMCSLEVLVLDDNLFEHAILGLEELPPSLTTLSLRRLDKWSGKGTLAVCDAISKMKRLRVLDMERSLGFYKGGVSEQFFERVATLDDFVVPHLPILDSVEMSNLSAVQKGVAIAKSSFKHMHITAMGFTPEQLFKGGVTCSFLHKVRYRDVQNALDFYTLRDFRLGGYTVTELNESDLYHGVQHDEATPHDLKGYRLAGYTPKELMDSKLYSHIEVVAAGFSSRAMFESGIDLLDLGVSLIKLKDEGELGDFTEADLIRAGFSEDELRYANISPSELKQD